MHVPDTKVMRILDSFLEMVQGKEYLPKVPNGQKMSFKPFFVSISLDEEEEYYITVRNGALAKRTPFQPPTHIGRVEIRMGDYERGGGFSSGIFSLPQDLNERAALTELSDTANEAFYDCIDDYIRRINNSIGVQDEEDRREKFLFFSREKSVRYEEQRKTHTLDTKGIEEMLLDISRKLMRPEIWNVELHFSFFNASRYLLTSEGTRIFTATPRYLVALHLVSPTIKSHYLLGNSWVFHSREMEAFPSHDLLMEKGERLIGELMEMRKAPVEKNGIYPAILDTKNHGVLWHEVIGHSLEAHRMQEDDCEYDESTPFEGNIGTKVAPSFITVHDDPTRKDLVGHYKYDDEGVKGKKTLLIEQGILKGYLHSRQSAGYFRTQSNGHARSSDRHDPIPRMSNIVVSSSKSIPFEELKEELMKQCVEQKREYGLLIEGTSGGFSLPEESYFNTTPTNIFRIYTNGNRERVRGIYIVGTPYQTLQNIVMTSDRYGAFHGVCGAESGWVSSSELAPDALVSSLEVKRIPNDAYERLRAPIFPRPRIER